MKQPSKETIARLVREARIAKGYTQQELSDKAQISLRSVQRIENAEVAPRMYTLKILAEQLGFSWSAEEAPADALPPGPLSSPARRRLNRAQKIILTIGIGVLLILLGGAFLAQSPRFPETTFESLLFWSGVAFAYGVIAFRIWK
ncbi:MAG TPA: helix-turn-helix domain-containing protein [Chitinophagaceae bacterium]|jgi:transcriptional regulator with XRE-family HTH domain